MTLQQQERSTLNDGIEERYILASDYAGSIMNYYENKRGALKDEYENFFLYFARLVQLTQCLEELSKEHDRKVVSDTKNWLLNKDKDTNFEHRVQMGLIEFEKYQNLLSNKGLIVLPTRGR